MDFLGAVWDFFLVEANQKALASIIGVLGLLGGLWLYTTGRLGALFKSEQDTTETQVKRGPTYHVSDEAQGGFAEAASGAAIGQVMGNQTIQHGAPVGHVTLSLDDYEARQKKLRSEVEAEMEGKLGEERAQLQARLDEVDRRLADPDTALKAAEERIAELEARLGNAETTEEQAARTALESGDLETARVMFERVEALTAPDVSKNASAHFALGRIAEEELRWPDAAGHYSRAAEIEENYEYLFEARKLAWLAGQHDRASEIGERLVGLVSRETTFGPEERASAFNEHGLTLKALGRHAEAEELYRNALGLLREAHGTEHPDYANQLNNLAVLLRTIRRQDEAEPLLRQALEIGQNCLGENHPHYAIYLNNLAGLLRDTG
ncbi:MAG: tetratricopeptide repeat protein, partial [Pseudomonadota bacterium]